MRYGEDDWNISAGRTLNGTEGCPHENQGIHAESKELLEV
jgi:hypothetical protein